MATKRLWKHLAWYYKRLPLSDRGRGLYRVGDVVCVRGRGGVVIEVVPFGMYPAQRAGLRVRGYCREHESYVVRLHSGRVRWPRVGCIERIGDGNE